MTSPSGSRRGATRSRSSPATCADPASPTRRARRRAPVPVRRELRGLVPRRGALRAPASLARRRMERASQRALRRALDDVRARGGVRVADGSAVARPAHDHGRAAACPIVYAIYDDWLSYAPELDAWSRPFRRLPAPARAPRSARCSVRPTVVPDLGTTGVLLHQRGRRAAGPRSYAPVHAAGHDDRVLRHRRPALHARTPAAARRPWQRPAALRRPLRPPQGHRDGDPRAGAPRRGRDARGAGHRRPGRASPAGGDRRPSSGVGRSRGVRRRRPDHARRALPSRRRARVPEQWEEPFGLIPLEAMACGTPVLATGVGGSGEFLSTPSTACGSRRATPPRWPRPCSAWPGTPSCAAQLDRARGRSTAAAFDVDRLTDCFEAWLVGAAAGFPAGRPPSRARSASRATVPSPDVRVGIVSWNTAALLDRCLAALPAALGALRGRGRGRRQRLRRRQRGPSRRATASRVVAQRAPTRATRRR